VAQVTWPRPQYIMTPGQQECEKHAYEHCNYRLSDIVDDCGNIALAKRIRGQLD
jgi:hypothetical protein